VLLVPKQLRRAGMTGNVPYYGGRFTPAQAYGASHPTAPPPSFADPMTAGGAFVRAPVPTPGPVSQTSNQPDTEKALQQLLDAGLISQAEYLQLRSRVAR
jgi:hypothetical protein